MKKIVIFSNPARDPEYTYTHTVEDVLMHRGFVTCRYDVPFDRNIDPVDFEGAFAILVLGGDGTILTVSHTASSYQLPILAVNLGRLGYIAQLERSDLEKIADILSSPFATEERSMLSVTLIRDKMTVLDDETVLNDAVIGKLNGRGMIEFELLANGLLVNNYRGDGMIFATATGSTAYSMSAGGPVIDPSLRIIEATPLAAHSLKARPIIFSEKHVLEVRISPSDSIASLTLDGERTLELRANDSIRISLSKRTTSLVSHRNDFCRILYQKMSEM